MRRESHRLRSCSGVDALGEDEGEDAQHSGQSVTDLSGRRAAEGNPGLEDPLLGADDPLLHRRGLGEEPGSHLGGGQSREEAQDEHDAFVLAQGRVGAGEEQAEAFVGHVCRVQLLAEALRVVVVVTWSQLGVVEGLLGEVEVPEPGDQRREQPPVVLLADGAEDSSGRIGGRVNQ